MSRSKLLGFAFIWGTTSFKMCGESYMFEDKKGSFIFICSTNLVGLDFSIIAILEISFNRLLD